MTSRILNTGDALPPDKFMKEYALEYARKGWKIIQLYGVKKLESGLYACTCKLSENCKSSGKHPVSVKWKEVATSDPKIIEKMDWKDRNLGIVTGEVSGLYVIDIDTKHDGEIHLKNWEKENNLALNDEARVITGSGGYHFYYKYPKGFGNIKNKTGILPGVDVRANGGQVVAPPSLHISGGKYEWEL